MGGRGLVTVREGSDKTAAFIEGALEGLETSTYLIVESEELSPSSPLRQFFREPGALRGTSLLPNHAQPEQAGQAVRLGISSVICRNTPALVTLLQDHLLRREHMPGSGFRLKI
jgi:hypothetical protein